MSQERELVLHPDFFTAFGSRIPPFAATQIMLKRGLCSNELTRFRYDVLMQIGAAGERTSEPEHRSWEDFRSVASVVGYVQQHEPPVLIITDVPNSRVRLDVSAVELLSDRDGPATVGHMRDSLRDLPPGIEPEEFWALEHDLPYRVQICWAGSGALDRINVHLVSGSVANGCVFAPAVADYKTDKEPLESFANSPAELQLADELGSALRNHLRTWLPEHMIPSEFAVVRKIPLTPNGKVDRKALAESAQQHSRGPRTFVAPRSELEQKIANLWKELLHVDNVGIHDNFFDLGGHSLLLVKLHMKLRESAGSHLTITDLFRFPTVGALAANLAGSRSAIETRAG